MLMDRPLKIEVLINSPGPHDEVRVRQPFLALQAAGVDCRLHERPFRFSTCIRPHSMVIWQRPLPSGWRQQLEHLQWLRERGCLLLTEWDDHPALFPLPIQRSLKASGMAALVACHAIHGSSAVLAAELKAWNPHVLTLENGVADIPQLSTQKHLEKRIRVMIGNQNRYQEHQELLPSLQGWLKRNPLIHIVIIGDTDLTNKLNIPHQVELHPRMDYYRYRELLRGCHIALLPLRRGGPERCKTVIKWAEASAESVAVVAGPELYNSVRVDKSGQSTCRMAAESSDVVAQAEDLAENHETRLMQVKAAHSWVQRDWSLPHLLEKRLELYRLIWRKRQLLDQHLLDRLGSSESLLHQEPFIP